MPAKHLRYRFSQSVRDQLEQIAWREWHKAQMKRNKAFFDWAVEPDSKIDLMDIIVKRASSECMRKERIGFRQELGDD